MVEEPGSSRVARVRGVSDADVSFHMDLKCISGVTYKGCEHGYVATYEVGQVLQQTLSLFVSLRGWVKT